MNSQSVLASVYIFALVLSRSIGQQWVRDIGFNDETSYLYSGVRLLQDGPVSAGYSPLYQLWYWLQSLLVTDRVRLYYFNWSALLFLNLLIFWRLCERLQVPRLLSVVLLAVLSTLSFFETWPFVTLLSTAGVGVAILLALRGRSWIHSLGIVSGAFGALAFVRPEFTISFLLSLALLAAGMWYGDPSKPRRAAVVALALAPFLVLFLTFGNPLAGSRSFIAFGQHYSLNVAHAESLRIDPWKNWVDIVRRDFAGSDSVSAALKANPKAFAWHLWANVGKMHSAYHLLTPSFAAPRLFRGAFTLCFAAAIVIGLLAGLNRMHAQRSPDFLRKYRPQLALLVVFSLVAVPSLISTLLIYPRAHYLLAPGFVVFAFSAWGLGTMVRRKWVDSADHRKSALAAGACCLLLLPGNSGLKPWYLQAVIRANEPGRLENLATVRFLQELSIVPEHGKTLTLLEPNFSRAVYAGWDFERIIQTECRPFYDCIQAKRPDIIVNDARLEHYYSTPADTGYKTFLAHPNALGYSRVDVPKQPVQFFVRREILRTK